MNGIGEKMTRTEVKLCTHCGKENKSQLPACPQCMMGLAKGTNPNFQSDSSTIPAIEKLVAAFPGMEIQHLIGHGGMGAVYQARQLNLDRIVALKILSPSLSRDPAFAERFLREARTLAKLTHSNIVTVFDFGQTDGFYYLTMEFVDGVNLRDTISANLLDPAEALAIVPQICDALQYAHDNGVVHRDIKPENILIAKSGSVKIADFGLAKILEPTPEQFTLTGTRQVLGTRNYMAPEQIESPDVVDHRADLYSLGVVFYELLTGELPLGRFALPSEKSSTIPNRLDDVVMRTLEKDPGRRYQQASQIKTACESVHAGALERENAPKAEQATAAARSGRPNDTPPADENLSTSQICLPFPVTIEDIFASLASGYGTMRGFETHLDLEYEIRDAIVDHKWAAKTARVPYDRIDWIKIHKGLIYTHIEIQADHVESVNELPNSKHGLFRVYLKKAHRDNAQQLVNFVQSIVARKYGNRPAPPVKSNVHAADTRERNHGSSMIAMFLVFAFAIFLLLFVSFGFVWYASYDGSRATRPVQVQQESSHTMEPMPQMTEMPEMPEMPRMKTMGQPEANKNSAEPIEESTPESNDANSDRASNESEET